MYGWIDRLNQVELLVVSGRIQGYFFFSKLTINKLWLQFSLSVFYPNLELELLINVRVHCCRKNEFRQSFTAFHLVTHYKVLNVASTLS